MDAALASHAWLAGDEYSIADAAFTPYVVRLEHLDIWACSKPPARAPTGIAACKAAAELRGAIMRWENAKYLDIDEARRPRKLAENPIDHAELE